jgi:hypothetical protein
LWRKTRPGFGCAGSKAESGNSVYRQREANGSINSWRDQAALPFLDSEVTEGRRSAGTAEASVGVSNEGKLAARDLRKRLKKGHAVFGHFVSSSA